MKKRLGSKLKEREFRQVPTNPTMTDLNNETLTSMRSIFVWYLTVSILKQRFSSFVNLCILFYYFVYNKDPIFTVSTSLWPLIFSSQGGCRRNSNFHLTHCCDSRCRENNNMDMIHMRKSLEKYYNLELSAFSDSFFSSLSFSLPFLAILLNLENSCTCLCYNCIEDRKSLQIWSNRNTFSNKSLYYNCTL